MTYLRMIGFKKGPPCQSGNAGALSLGCAKSEISPSTALAANAQKDGLRHRLVSFDSLHVRLVHVCLLIRWNRPLSMTAEVTFLNSLVTTLSGGWIGETLHIVFPSKIPSEALKSVALE